MKIFRRIVQYMTAPSRPVRRTIDLDARIHRATVAVGGNTTDTSVIPARDGNPVVTVHGRGRHARPMAVEVVQHEAWAWSANPAGYPVNFTAWDATGRRGDFPEMPPLRPGIKLTIPAGGLKLDMSGAHAFWPLTPRVLETV